ncbi:hypothetical protein HNQ59_002015 [Chitinivorax tropicus]|uniref:Uncharacterized protein n=1 Tax=Chitinivorax tropicus TaxID=714531 RepID=A0A840MPQ3_9PROT|nr:hypothetical protein [Chitinivorax tropicus]
MPRFSIFLMKQAFSDRLREPVAMWQQRVGTWGSGHDFSHFNQLVGKTRTGLGFVGCWGFALHHQQAVEIQCFELSLFFDSRVNRFVQAVTPQPVWGLVDFAVQFVVWFYAGYSCGGRTWPGGAASGGQGSLCNACQSGCFFCGRGQFHPSGCSAVSCTSGPSQGSLSTGR